MTQSPGHRGAARPPAWPLRLLRAFLARERTRDRRSRGWRLLVPVMAVAAGALFVTSAVSSGGTDLRPGEYQDLTDLANARADRLKALQDRVATLSGEVEQLSDQVSTSTDPAVLARLDALRAPAGLESVAGPGITVTLDDAPGEVLASAGDDVANAIVHQQDIQAVANALWRGGAEAMSLQGQRVITTTGIKCVGNSVVLHGVPYSPPYVIRAIGDPDEMMAAIGDSAYIDAYLQAVDDLRLGWGVRPEDRLELPAYAGVPQLKYARPAGNRDEADPADAA